MLKLLRKFDSLIRLLDFRLASNRFAVLASVLAGAAVFGYQIYDGAGFADAAVAGVAPGLGVFASWAIARELHPDDPRAATVACVVATGLLFIGFPALGVCFGILFAARIAARTVGQSLTPLDLVVLIGFAFYLATDAVGVPAAAGLGVAMILDARLPQPAPRTVQAAGFLAILAALAGAIFFANFEWEVPVIAEWAVVGAVTGALIGTPIPEPVTTDDRHKPLNRERLEKATWLAAGIGFLTFVVVGGPAAGKLGPLWAALVGVAALRRRPVEAAI